MTDGFAAMIQKCQTALEIKYDGKQLVEAKACLEAEQKLIEDLRLTEVLLRAAEFGSKLQQSGRACRLNGSSCSSMVNFLLGLSEVDPIRHHTLSQRFWITNSGAAPRFRFLVELDHEHTLNDSQLPEGTIVHEMTPLEVVADIAQRQHPRIDIPTSDVATFEAMTAGDTDGVFQFESDHVRRLVGKIRPRSIDDLAIVTALAAIECSHPEVAADFVSQHEQPPQAELHFEALSVTQFKAPLFQETIMSILHYIVGLGWIDSWRFILESVKNRLNPNHPLWEEAARKAIHKSEDETKVNQWIESLAQASRIATCRAHHLANAITSYRAAFIRTHFRKQFEQTLETVC